MEKSRKPSRHSSSVTKPFSRLLALTAAFFFGSAALAQAKKTVTTPAVKAGATQESYRDLIAKAQNLTLQHDRLQTSQVLIRAIQREIKGSPGYRELTKALDELTAVFYTERAQSAFVAGESAMLTRPREALDPFQEALRVEEGNVAILKNLARTHLMLGECDRAEGYVKAAEGLNPYASEILLLRLQVLDCAKSSELTAKLQTPGPDFESIEKNARAIQLRELSRRKEWKKAKALLTTWETQAPDYPEVSFWKWELSKSNGGPVDRAAAVRYVQLCQNLTPRKRKSFNLDVDLCKEKENADTYLKETALQPTASPSQDSADDD